MTTYFISGHCDITEDEFSREYHDKLETAVLSGANFVVGDARGVDIMAQKYLSNRPGRVTVYHLFDTPLNIANPAFKTIGGFQTHDQKDTAMTRNSNADILWIRSEEEQKKLYGKKYRYRISGTEKNLNRRRNQ